MPDANQAANQAANAEQSEAWNGPTGTKWVQYQDRLDRMLQPFCDVLLKSAAIQPGETILDIGCGCGVTTIEAAKQVGPTGQVLGVDISAPMTAKARERAASAKVPATFDVADASSHAFKPATFDLLISRFGVMFFDAPAPAFANIRRALKPDARMVFVCWRPAQENPWLSTPSRAAMPLLPPQPAPVPFAPGPFAFADKDHVSAILTEAGFKSITFTPYDTPLLLGQTLDDALQQALDIGPLARLLVDQPSDIRARAVDAVRTELAKHLTPAGVALGGATWIVEAKA